MEDPYVRETLKKCDKTPRRLGKMTKSANKDIGDWASRALYAVENEDVHDFWSNVITEPVNEEELQQLRDRVPENDGELTEPAKASRYVNFDEETFPLII